MIKILQIEEKILQEYLALGKHSTASSLIETALKEYILSFS